MSITPSIQIGQRWRTRGGSEVEVADYRAGNAYPWQIVSNSYIATVDKAGRAINLTTESPNDLVELIQDSRLDLAGIELTETHVDVAPGALDPQNTAPDSDALAAETLEALGWSFNGQTWVQDQIVERDAAVLSHPLYPIFVEAIEQAMYGKGERHGGARTPFLEQPWVHYVKMHGRGFATGQGAKKLEEAASTRDGEPFDQEVKGAIVYAGMAILKNRGAV